MNKNKGISLIGLIVYIVIVAVLLSVFLPKILGGSEQEGANSAEQLPEGASQAVSELYISQLKMMLNTMKHSNASKNPFSEFDKELHPNRDPRARNHIPTFNGHLTADAYIYLIDGFDRSYDTVNDTTFKSHSNGWFTQAVSPACDASNKCHSTAYIYSIKRESHLSSPANIEYFQEKGCAIYVKIDEKGDAVFKMFTKGCTL